MVLFPWFHRGRTERWESLVIINGWSSGNEFFGLMAAARSGA
jgi:hypothetical protein